MRKIEFINNEYYHIFNRGVEKRDIFMDKEDLNRFFQSMSEFNTINPIGSIYESIFRKKHGFGSLASKSEKLVDFICYCLCPNHYHFVLQQLTDRGIEKFMHRLGSGYTNYFNNKYKRSGSLFQGTFKANHIDSNEYLLHISAYINLNNKVHQFTSEFFKSSWEEYFLPANVKKFCNPDIVLKQFVDSSKYKSFAEDSILISRNKKEYENLEA